MKRILHTAWILAFLSSLPIVNAQSWKIIYECSEPFPESLLRNLYFTNDSTGWIVGSQNLVYKTVNSGSSWGNQSFSGAVSLKPISFSAPPIRGFVGLRTNKSYVTINSGDNWLQIPPITIPDSDILSTRISDMQFISPDTGWLVTETGSIHKSVNGGVEWVLASYYPNIKFEDIHFIDEETGWVCGYHVPISFHKGYILKTEDGGETWEVNLENTTGTYGIFHTIQFIDKNTGWATGGDNQIFKTINGGNTWTATVIDPALGDGNAVLNVFSHFFINDTLGWLSCLPLNETYRNLIYMTFDGGATWRQQSIERDSTVGKIFMTGPTTGYAVTASARVLRYEARPAECGALPVFPAAGSGNIPLQPLLRWHPAPGGTDGYRIAIGTTPGSDDLLPLTDVGLDTFFHFPAMLPSNTMVHVSIFPYSQYFGEAGCSDAFSFTTVTCPAPTVVDASICKNDSLLFADSLITAAGLYEWTYTQPSGCDSLVQLFVSFFPDEVTETDTMLVLGQPFNGVVYDRDTTLEFVLQTVDGCDSLLRVHLQLVTTIQHPDRPPMAMHLFPNPASGEVTLQFQQAPSTTLRVWFFNELGQAVLTRKLPAHRQDHRIGTDRLPSGTYRIVAMTEGAVVAVAKLVVL